MSDPVEAARLGLLKVSEECSLSEVMDEHLVEAERIIIALQRELAAHEAGREYDAATMREYEAQIETLQRELDKACGCTIDEGGDVTDKCDWHFEAAKLDRAEIDRLQRERDELKAVLVNRPAERIAHGMAYDLMKRERDVATTALEDNAKLWAAEIKRLRTAIEEALGCYDKLQPTCNAAMAMTIVLRDALKGEGE